MSVDSLGVSGTTPTTSNAPSQQLRNPFAAGGPLANLDLSSTQQQQIQNIFSEAQSQGLNPSQVQSQINAVLTPQQQQQLQSDIQQFKSQHHHGNDGPNVDSLAQQLNLTSAQQDQINQLVQSAQANGTSPSTLLSEINGVLTSSQQSQLAQLLSTPAYTSSGSSNSSATSPSYVLNTTA